MKACDIMSDRFAECYIDGSIDDLRRLPGEGRTAYVVLLDEKGKPSGVIDDQALARYDRARHNALTSDMRKSNSTDETAIRVDSEKEPIRNWMLKNFIRVGRHASMQKIVKCFGDEKLAYCLVQDERNERILGVIGRHEASRCFKKPGAPLPPK